MTLTVTTTFDLGDNVTLAAYKNDEHIGTMVIKEGKLKYYNFLSKNTEEYSEDNISVFEDYCSNENITFKKVADRKWISFQPNPMKNNTTDCTFRAYAKAEGISWDEAYDIASTMGKEMKLMPNDHKVVDKILKDKFKYSYTKLNKEDKKTINEFSIEHPEGIYILWSHGHVTTLYNGYYYDSWDSGDKKIKGYYTKK